MLRVLQIVDSLGMGGAETWLMEVLRHWSQQSTVQMDFLITSGNRGIFDDEARRLGSQIYYVRYGRSRLPHFVRDFRRILNRGRYQAVHDHADYASGWHFIAGAGLLPLVRVTHVHNPSYQILSNYGTSHARRLTQRVGKSLVSRYATYIAGTSRRVLTEYGFDGLQFERIPKAAVHCGFEPSRFLGDVRSMHASVCHEFGWPADSLIVLFAGRIDQSADVGDAQNHKNSGFAVSVGIECARREPKVRMLLAGKSSPAVPILEQRIAAAHLQDRIRFTGIRTDIERLMVASDVLLFPSRGEGLGMVAVEAQAAGLPVLASTSVPGECVVDPDLVRFRDVSAGCAQWADDLLELAALPRDNAGANGKVARSAFAISHSASALARLYLQGSAA